LYHILRRSGAFQNLLVEGADLAHIFQIKSRFGSIAFHAEVTIQLRNVYDPLRKFDPRSRSSARELMSGKGQ
jgi:hypothetical protein